MRQTVSILLFLGLCSAADAPFSDTPAVQSALDRISPDSLKGNLSFLASDLLEGRDTPSRGLEIAGEYIAAQFRKAGLEPAGGGADYFQNAKLVVREPHREGLVLTFATGEKKLSIPGAQIGIDTSAALDLKDVPVFKLDLTDAAQVASVTPEQLNGTVVLAEFTRTAMQNARAAMGRIRSSKPALIVMLERKTDDSLARVTPQLYDPENRPPAATPRVSVSGDEATRFYDELKPGLSDTKATVHIAAPSEKPVMLRNVVGILRGSDPSLKDTCVLLSAHYDHVGQKTQGDGDRIYNGANDDGSGTVSVIEIASALATLKQRPKRSIVFVTFFGEEKGGFGSQYYVRHPAMPLAQTIADINLEQVGRTDSTEGEQIGTASLTGFDYSNVPAIVKAAGDATGIKVYKHERNSDQYFAQSDNVFLAQAGVPAHSLTVAFNYSDYHGLGDEWPKIDYANMAKVDRMVATALLMLADAAEPPHWDATNPKAGPYLKAWKQLHP